MHVSKSLSFSIAPKSRISASRIKTLTDNRLTLLRIAVINANFVYCFVCKEVLSTGHDGGGDGHGVVSPPHSQVADLLPGFPSWVPREHRGEGVAVAVLASSQVEDVSDHGGL